MAYGGFPWAPPQTFCRPVGGSPRCGQAGKPGQHLQTLLGAGCRLPASSCPAIRDVWVVGSRRYADPASYLIPEERWPILRTDLCQLTGIPANGKQRLEELGEELRGALEALEQVLESKEGSARLDEQGRLVLTRLAADDPLPAAASPPGCGVGAPPPSPTS